MVRLRPATDEDWMAVSGVEPPAEWFGLASGGPHLVEGLGAVFRGTDGGWWLTFYRCPGVGRRLRTAHEGARQLLALADARGLSVRALPDPSKPGAETWLRRLGFARTAAEQGGIAIWTR